MWTVLEDKCLQVLVKHAWVLLFALELVGASVYVVIPDWASLLMELRSCIEVDKEALAHQRLLFGVLHVEFEWIELHWHLQLWGQDVD